MTGFFPIMMFALPAAALAIWRNAKPSQKKVVGGIMLSTALTAFLTGITEPLEFAFMFVAWPLYLIHAFLTGTSMALVNALGIHDGFTFSAGFFDYVLNFGKATNAWMLIPIGLGLRGDLLLPVQLRHQEVEPAHARPKEVEPRKPNAATDADTAKRRSVAAMPLSPNWNKLDRFQGRDHGDRTAHRSRSSTHAAAAVPGAPRADRRSAHLRAGALDAASMLAVMTLGAEFGTEVTIRAEGEGARRPSIRLADLLASELDAA